MKIHNFNRGRLGNTIFRMLANIVFLIVYDINGNIVTNNINKNNNMMDITDDYFVKWSELILNGNIPKINKECTLYFSGFYQHDKIFNYFKTDILNYLNNNPELLLLTDRNEIYKAYDLVNNKNSSIYDIVVHLRLEDFMENGQIINPESISLILNNLIKKNKIQDKTICFVVNTPKTHLENKYIDFFKNKYNITVESNDPISDFNIMKNAKILVCSYSTLSWCASFFSDTIKELYIPNYNSTLHQTFKNPIENVTLYDFNFCNKDQLNIILNEKSYSLNDNLGKPIDIKLDELFKNKKNGFYIELGAFDGLSQSNSAFFEFNRNWTGMLIEPSVKSYELCKLNRPNSYVVNKCCVSNNYNDSTIKGDFNGCTMSSVDGKRMNNTEDSKLIEVPATTLEKILDIYFTSNEYKHIDFLSLDTEGYEYEILKGLNFNKYSPSYLLIEIYKKDFELIVNYLNNYGYKIHSNFTNYNLNTNPGWDGTHNDYLFYKSNNF